MEEGPAVGLIFCRCGPNIGQVVRLGDLALGGAWPGAALVATHDVLCSPEGREWLAWTIRERALDRVVVAGCSPREHQGTFQDVLRAAGLNPFRLQMANIREQCEWLGGPPDVATEKARRLVAAAMARVVSHEDLVQEEVPCNPDALVVGGGVAGLSAALTLAQKGRAVLVLERSHALGGRVALLDETFPGMECASCFLEPALDRVLHHPNIRVVTGAEVSDVKGYFGRFTVTYTVRPRGVDPGLCIGCGTCTAACPVETEDPLAGRLSKRKAIQVPYAGCLPFASAIHWESCLNARGEACDACAAACPFGAVSLNREPSTGTFECGAVVLATGYECVGAPSEEPDALTCFQLERMLHPNGPTGGKVRLASGEAPASVLLALTARSRNDGETGWQEILKLAHRLSDKLPGAVLTVAGGAPLPRDGTDGTAAELRARGVRYLPGTLRGGVRRAAPKGPLAAVLDDGEGLSEVEADMVVVHTHARSSPGAAELASLLRIPADDRGFLPDRASPFEPGSSPVLGVGVAGGAAGPRTISESIRDGAAAAARVLSRLVPGETLTLEAAVSRVDAERCSACGVCRSACPFGAITRDAVLEASHIEAALCHGCGTCAAACPSGAIVAHHFRKGQIRLELEALLAPESLKGG